MDSAANRRWKSLSALTTDSTIVQRMSKKIKKGPGCWEWTGSKTLCGYGQIRFEGRLELAHRVMWILVKLKRIPKKLCVMHSCDNPGCVRPTHLKLGTHAENSLDMKEKGRSAVIRGGDSPRAKLSWDDAYEIRRLCYNGLANQKQLAERYGVTQPTISYIVNKKHYVRQT